MSLKIVVLGAGGLLGRHVVEELSKQQHQVVALDRKACDVADRTQVLDGAFGAMAIVNCAAWTDVDGAEAHEEAAYRANAIGAENAAHAAIANGAAFLHVSTDFVFDGAKPEPYDEFDRPNPQSKYARSKWAGEELIARLGWDRSFLVRVQGLYGAGGRNFSSKLRQLILDGKPLKLDAERKVQPTWARAAARQIAALLDGEEFGVYHVSCKGAATWAEFARHVAAKLRVEPRWEEVPTSALRAPANRPANCLFRHRMLELRGLDRMPAWEAALDEYLDEESRRVASRDTPSPSAQGKSS